MKIVHAVYSMELGGAEMLVAQLSRMQREAGHHVIICCYSKLGRLGEMLQAEGFDLRVLGEAHPAKTMLRYLRLFRVLKPDVVHCHNPAPTLQAAAPARVAGAACVLATRHSLVSPPYDTAAEVKFSLLASFLDHIVGICEITCENLRGAPLARRDRIVRVYNGVAELVETEPLATDGFTFLFVGRLAEVKDLPTMLRAFAQAVRQRPELRLWIIGDGPVRASLERLAAELDVAGQVCFWGERLDTAQFFRAAQVFTMSSTSEGLPMSLLQSMSIGLPALVTDVGGMREVVSLAESGLRTPVGDATAMAEAMLRLAVDTELRARCGEQGREAFARHFTLRTMHESYLRLYRSVRPIVD